ncbi:hypothetical protein KP509_27G033100 [Ceratopteris richardii]|uniref:Late embryogenesis abundant protein LEA-2 subgroup domain-containing protein n=1 Tax=Ceratopteris richardii TaxID=49495 RepID=A0A8T2RGU9_CERRI|nr:hypothetical protein KP509_27G033100 [Ceratopteris richardii]
MVEYGESVPFHRRRPCLCCCAVFLSLVVIIGIIILILAFTVFKPKKPTITVESLDLKGFSVGLDRSNLIPTPTVNITLALVVSLRNPNKASVKYAESTSIAYYYEDEVASVPIPAGYVGSDSTVNISTTLVAYADRLASNSHLAGDLVAGELPMTTETRISGRVKVGFIKRHIDITSHCNISIVVRNASIGNMDCQDKVHF